MYYLWVVHFIAPHCLRVAAVSHVALPIALCQGYPSSVTISGCGNAADCGIYRLVSAHCIDAVYGHCPGGDLANGNVDPTLCDGAPTYQNADGKVLFRYIPYAGTSSYSRWYVSGIHALTNCHGDTWYLQSASFDGPLGYAPTAPEYSAGDGWHDDYNGQNGHIIVTAGGGR